MRRVLYSWIIAGWALTFVLLLAAGAGLPGAQKPKPTPKKSAALQPVLLSPTDQQAFAERFAKEIWPLLSRSESACLTCHDGKTPNPLRLYTDAGSTFKALLTDGHFDAENPGSILARVSAPDKARKMPPEPHKPWADAEIQTLRTFTDDLYEKLHAGKVKTDEIFPPALLARYTGKTPYAAPDNTFLSYHQLRGKIAAIFGDDWKRDGRDLFSENIALFNGADFVRRFDESTKASATFLTGVEMMSRDVASRAYMARTGPFRGHPASMPSPLTMKAPDALYRREINRLYHRMLFRDATPRELADSFRFIQAIYRQQKALSEQEQDARFELTVRDESGLSTTQGITVRLFADRLGLFQDYVDQNDGPAGNLVKKKLGDAFTLKAGNTGQRLEVSNRGTSGIVSVQAVELRGPLPAETTKMIPVTDPSVQVQGAWRLVDREGVKSYEDGNQHKGKSQLIIPLKVERDGRYEIALWWRRSGAPTKKGKRVSGPNADNVPVEIFSHDRSRLSPPPPEPIPPKGQAHFTVDQSDDTLPYVEIKTAFRFAEQDGVEINNNGTHRQVVADAIRYLPTNGGETLTVTNDLADGLQGWSDYDPGAFNYYRKISKKLLTDGNANKGERKLLFRPAALKEKWKPGTLYRVQVCYPGRDGNETQAPVVVHAVASSPIVRVSHPARAPYGATVRIDASGSYNIQQSKLTYVWKQIGGPRIDLRKMSGPVLEFEAPTMTPQQAAWEGLCRALMKHPDFLFTRPRSLATITDARQRRRLQLVKIAQDLVARTPTEAEIKKLDSGASLDSLIDGYLNSQEFRDFYFRRIRLYLESRGSEIDDEPVRLWCYVAFNNRPFKEILTADYTVDTRFRRQPRPAYHGKTGLLTMKGFIDGKPGLPHFNYAAQVAEKFLGYVFEVPSSIVEMRNLITAVSTTNPNTVCYSCHKILTPLAYQRGHWTDKGEYRPKDEDGKLIDDSDRKLVPSYPFKGNGMEAFALQAQNKERFIRTILQTHFIFYFGREMRYQADERALYKRLWDKAHACNFAIRPILKTLLTSREYLDGPSTLVRPPGNPKLVRAGR